MDPIAGLWQMLEQRHADIDIQPAGLLRNHTEVSLGVVEVLDEVVPERPAPDDIAAPCPHDYR